MKNYKFLTLLIVLSLLFSCSANRTLKFNQKPDEIINTNTLKDFLSKNKNPKVVLRVQNSSYTLTKEDSNHYLYNAIENQLLSSGFIVRDRQLFNQISGNAENNVEYQKLKEKSDTDIIIELTKLKTNILYETDRYFDAKGDQKKVSGFTYKRYGASVEFKIILIHSNEFAGVYKFNYTPCTDGCNILSLMDFKKQQKEIEKEKENQKEKFYEGVERDTLEMFMKSATRKLVKAMRK